MSCWGAWNAEWHFVKLALAQKGIAEAVGAAWIACSAALDCAVPPHLLDLGVD